MSSIGLSNINEYHPAFGGVEEDTKKIALGILESMDQDGDGRLDIDEVARGVINAAKESKQAALTEAALTRRVRMMESLHFLCSAESNGSWQLRSSNARITCPFS